MKSLVTYIFEARLNYQLGYKLATDDGVEVLNSDEMRKYESRNGYDYILIPNIPEIVDIVKNVDVMGDKWMIVTCKPNDLDLSGFENVIPSMDAESLSYKDVVKTLNRDDSLMEKLIKFINDNKL